MTETQKTEKAVNLKFFDRAPTKLGFGRPGIVAGRIFSLCKEGDKVTFREECDGHFSQEMPKDEAVEILKEAIAWLNSEAP